jgi:hypothetical protein
MNELFPRIIGLGVLFTIVFLSGFRLYRSGRPINTVVLTLHKLIALGALILIGVTIHQVNQVTALSSAAWIATALTGVLFITTIITGGLLSLAQPVTTVAIVHKIGPFATVIGVIVSMFLLANPQS